MAVYLVERDLPGVSTEELAAAQKRAIQVGRDLTAEGRDVRYIRSTFVPGEHKCMCLFEASNPEDVREANERAKIPFTRIVPAEDLTFTVRIDSRVHGFRLGSSPTAARALLAGLVNVGGKARSTCMGDAGDRTQVFIDRAEVVVGHVGLDRPGHDLKNATVEGWRSDATLSTEARTGGMRVIKIMSCSDDREEFLEGMATYR